MAVMNTLSAAQDAARAFTSILRLMKERRTANDIRYPKVDLKKRYELLMVIFYDIKSSIQSKVL